MCVCVSCISVSLNPFFGPSCLLLPNIMSRSSCSCLIHVQPSRVVPTSFASFLVDRLDPMLKLRLRLSSWTKTSCYIVLCLERYPSLNWSLLLFSLHQGIISWSFLWFYLSKLPGMQVFFLQTNVHFYLFLGFSICLWGLRTNCTGICDWLVCQLMNVFEESHSQCLVHRHGAVTALMMPCLT